MNYYTDADFDAEMRADAEFAESDLFCAGI